MRVFDSKAGAPKSNSVNHASNRRFGRIGGASAILLVLTFAAGSGSDPGESENAQAAERFARATYPLGPWVEESEFPKPSPKSPLMVIREVTQYAPGIEPTSEQAKAAQELVESCYESATRNGWYDYDKGRADGFEPPPRDPRHFRNPEFMLDDEILDPDRPEVLMYYPTASGKLELVGFMFMASSRSQWGPQVGGPLTVWHYHIWRKKQCVERGVISLGFVDADQKCETGVGHHRSLEMMHVWLIDHPQGPFATPMALPQDFLEKGIAKRKRERGF